MSQKKTAGMSDALKQTYNELRARFMTPTALATKLDITKPTAYARINRMRDAFGVKFDEREEREGTRGPAATAYKVAS